MHFVGEEDHFHAYQEFGDDCTEVCPGDFDDSGTVDVSDLLLVISEWGESCS